MVGVTGTNGKTTTAFLVRQLLEAAGRRTGLLGTVQSVVGGEVADVERTTPEAIDLQAIFARMLEAGDAACVMEVSSHALVLHRADAIQFDAKAFTNLTQDHLDFHDDMEDYFAAKRLLFTAEGGSASLVLEGGVSVVNVDDAYGRRLADELRGGRPRARRWSRSRPRAPRPTSSATDVSFDATGSSFRLGGPDGLELDVRTPLPGDFNVANALGGARGRPRARARRGAGGRGAGRRRAGAGPLRADRRGPGVRGAGRLRAHARLGRERAARRRGG